MRVPIRRGWRTYWPSKSYGPFKDLTIQDLVCIERCSQRCTHPLHPFYIKNCLVFMEHLLKDKGPQLLEAQDITILFLRGGYSLSLFETMLAIVHSACYFACQPKEVSKITVFLHAEFSMDK